jgi:hypothetical protein
MGCAQAAAAKAKADQDAVDKAGAEAGRNVHLP